VSLDVLQPYGPSRHATGILLPVIDLKLCRTRNSFGRIVGYVNSALESFIISSITGIYVCVLNWLYRHGN
jgi:hypothetical protein